MEKANTLATVKGVGRVVEVSRNFYDNLNALRENFAKVISGRQEAIARMETAGTENIGRSYGTYLNSGFEYAKGQMPVLRLKSRLLDPKLARLAVEANKQSRYFSTGDTQFYEESLKQAEKEVKEGREPWKRQVIVMLSRDLFAIKSDKNFDVLEFELRDPKLAKQYFEFNGSNPMNVYLVDKSTVDVQDGTLLTQVWFWNLGNRSDVIGGSRFLSNAYRVRGVLPTAEGRTQKIPSSIKSEPYTPKQVGKIYDLIQGVKEGKLPASKLEKALSFLESLRGKN